MSLFDVMNIVQVCFDVSVVMFVSMCRWCVLRKITQAKCVFAHV